MACCPSHEDKNPSLAIKELHDGRVLINCFAGCGGADIMAAIGMSLSDLYPDGELQEWMRSGGRKRAVERTQAKQLDQEYIVLAIATNARESGARLSQADMDREYQAYMAVRRSV